MTNPIDIRATIARDVPTLKTIVDATELFPSEMLDAMVAGHLGGDGADIWLTAEAGDGPVALAYCEPERVADGAWNLLAIAVAPDWQGKGVGAALVHHLEALLRQREQRILIVETSGLPAFARTRSFYLHNGYAEEARIRDFYGQGDDKIVFWKSLVAHA